METDVHGIIRDLTRHIHCSPDAAIQAIAHVIDKTGYSPEESKGLLEELFRKEGELTKALDHVESKTFYAIKIRFQGIRLKVWGLFFAMLDPKEERMERVDVLLTHNPWFVLYDINAEWERFENYLGKTKAKSSSMMQEMAESLKGYIQHFFEEESEKRRSFFETFRTAYLEGTEPGKVEEMLEGLISNGMGEAKVSIKRFVTEEVHVPSLYTRLKKIKFLLQV
jgi:hypothetical protein